MVIVIVVAVATDVVVFMSVVIILAVVTNVVVSVTVTVSVAAVVDLVDFVVALDVLMALSLLLSPSPSQSLLLLCCRRRYRGCPYRRCRHFHWCCGCCHHHYHHYHLRELFLPKTLEPAGGRPPGVSFSCFFRSSQKRWKKRTVENHVFCTFSDFWPLIIMHSQKVTSNQCGRAKEGGRKGG